MSGPEAVAVTVAIHTNALDLRAGTAFIQERRGAHTYQLGQGEQLMDVGNRPGVRRN